MTAQALPVTCDSATHLRHGLVNEPHCAQCEGFPLASNLVGLRNLPCGSDTSLQHYPVSTSDLIAWRTARTNAIDIRYLPAHKPTVCNIVLQDASSAPRPVANHVDIHSAFCGRATRLWRCAVHVMSLCEIQPCRGAHLAGTLSDCCYAMPLVYKINMAMPFQCGS